MPARRVQIRGSAAVLATAAALLLAACGGGGSGSTSSGGGAAAPTGASAPSATSTTSITISNFMFSPMAASVAPGATVTVTNKDSVVHTLSATDGRFTTGDIAPGRAKTFSAPTAPGTYHYICGIHQYMTGTIVVR